MKRHTCICAAAAAVLVAGGPAAAASAAPFAQPAAVITAATPAPVEDSAQGAIDAALKSYPGTVESVAQEGRFWHVRVVGKDNGKNAEIQLDRASGALTRLSEESNDSGEYTALLKAKVTAAQAMKAALASQDGRVWWVSWDDDDDNGGAPYWSVAVRSDDGLTHIIGIDATAGKVTSSHVGDGVGVD